VVKYFFNKKLFKMKRINQFLKITTLLFIFGIVMLGCQKMDRPGFGNYAKDSNPPGGPLKFYVAFDGATTNASMNAVDSIKASFPSDNPLASVAGISGKAMQGESKKFVKYAKPNDWASTAKSFTISFWIKKNGQTQNNKGTNGPEYAMSFKSNNGHWSGANLFVLLEGNNAGCAVKLMAVDKKMADNWLTWEGGNSIPGILDNTWHHVALVYNASASSLTLYKDGVANPNVRTWAAHGDINFDNAAIDELRVGCGPGTSYDSDDWLSSSLKGALDQFRLYSTALTGTEVSALFSGKL
jgi:Concanavalin A-like lectin/glucanases superfamily